MGKTKALVADDGTLDKRQRQIRKLLRSNDRFGIFLGAGSGKTRILIRHILWLMKRERKLNCLVVSTKANALDTWPTQFKEQMKLTGIRVPMHVHHSEYKGFSSPGINCQYSARV